VNLLEKHRKLYKDIWDLINRLDFEESDRDQIDHFVLERFEEDRNRK